VVEDEKTEDTEIIRTDGAERRHLRLLVAGEGVYAMHALPDAGDVLIGRSERADVSIDDPLISRRHAILHIGERIVLEDLGSANGVRVRDTQLSPNATVEVRPGDAIDAGSTTLIVQRGVASRRPRRVLSHGAFEARLEEECARAEGTRGVFAVLRIHAGGPVDPTAVQEALGRELRAVDVIATYGPTDYEVLLLETAPERAADIARRIGGALGTLRAEVRVGLGCFPRDGTGPEEILARACDEARDERTPSESAIMVPDGAMQRIGRLVKRIAVGTISVLILGETGVGKEVLAETIHRESPRRGQPFLRLNCAALSESLLSSELFGHERGAFTGALQAKIGLLESANGGTVFLDEVGDLPMPIQVKLLRVLEERQVLRVGAVKPRLIDVRFLAATNRDLEAEIEHGNFRQDLFFRLNGISIVIPPLRERVDEIEGLVKAFIAHSVGPGNRGPRVSSDAMALLKSYRWPGNIRELRNVMERAVLLAAGSEITKEHMPVEKMEATLLSRPSPRNAVQWIARGLGAPATVPRPSTSAPKAKETGRPAAPASSAGDSEPPPTVRGPSEDERLKIIDALDRCAGNQTKAARMLAISRRTLVSRIELYRLPRPRKSSRS
jgi:two-component system response regulator AtoC